MKFLPFESEIASYTQVQLDLDASTTVLVVPSFAFVSEVHPDTKYARALAPYSVGFGDR
jgi:hypothetical protein